MALETGTRIPDLVASNPVGATDFVSVGDDHIRLLKACIQGSFPSLGSGQCSASAAELSHVAGVTSAIQTQLNAKAPSANPTFTGTVTLPNNSVADAALSSNVALKTGATYSGQIQSSVAAAGANAGFLASSAIPVYAWRESDAGTNEKLWDMIANGGQMSLRAVNDANSDSTNVLSFVRSGYSVASITINGGNVTVAAPGSGFTLSLLGADPFSASDGTHTVRLQMSGGTAYFGTTTNHALYLLVNGTTGVQIAANGGTLFGAPTGGNLGANTINAAGVIARNGVAVESLPAVSSTSTTLVKGQAHYIAGNATLPALAAGEWVSIINNSGSPITITVHSGDTTYWTTGAASVATLTVPARGRIFAEGVGSSTVYVSGDVSGYT